MKANKFMFAPSNKKTNETSQSTNKIILDYLLYLSIQSRLRQARVELLELSTPLHKDDTLEVRKKRWVETASKAEQDKNAVESVVAGILSSHCTRKPSFQLDCNFEQRLHLCQLTNLVFGRFDALSTGQHVIAHSSSRRRRHEFSFITEEQDVVSADEECDYLKKRQLLFSKPILPPFCRRHRIQGCYGCRSSYLKDKPENAMNISQVHHVEEHETNEDKNKQFRTLDLASISPPTPPAGLIEAIPTFLRTSADMLRRMLEVEEDDEKSKPMMFAGQKVMGGGMPPRWYDLFLELLTQAAIESYLCDTQAGLEPIFEIFSYGDVEDEDEDHDDDDDDDEEEEEHEEEHIIVEEEDLDEWGIRAADHHLLFPKTRTMYLFKTQVREREKDFLSVDGVDLKTHFEKLAQTFPLQGFEKGMGDFIQMILDSMDIPALDKYEQNSNDNNNNNNSSSISNNNSNNNSNNTDDSLKGGGGEEEEEEGGGGGGNKNTNLNNNNNNSNHSNNHINNKTTTGPKVYKYPGDGSLLMPEIPDEEEKITMTTTLSSSPLAQQAIINELIKKRRGSNLEAPVEPKRTK